MTTKFRADRLLLLADFLERLPDKRFDYGHWIGNGWKGDPGLSCGTTACALGWATAIPEFQALGLCAVKRPNGNITVGIKDDLDAGQFHRAPERAGEYVFGLADESEFDELFVPDDHWDCEERSQGECIDCEEGKPCGQATAKQVAAHIRRFVAAKESK